MRSSKTLGGDSNAAAAAAKSLQSCLTVRPHRRQPTRLPRPWDSPGKNTGVGCHILLQCMKVKSESEVAQSCLTLSDPMDCSLPGSSVRGIFQAGLLEWGAIAFSKIQMKEHQRPLAKNLSCTSKQHEYQLPAIVNETVLGLPVFSSGPVKIIQSRTIQLSQKIMRNNFLSPPKQS